MLPRGLEVKFSGEHQLDEQSSHVELRVGAEDDCYLKFSCR